MKCMRGSVWLLSATRANPAKASEHLQQAARQVDDTINIHQLAHTLSMHLDQISTIDWGILSLLLAASIIGFFRGFLKDFVGASILCLAGVISLTMAKSGLYVYLKPYVANETYRLGINIACVMSCVWLCTLPIKKWCHQSIKDSTLSGVNRTLGFALGACKGFALLVMMCILTVIIHPDIMNKTPNSLVLPKTYQLAKRIMNTETIKSFIDGKAFSNTHDEKELA